MNSINVFAPATVANVVCGFDVLGFAVDFPGDEAVVSLSDTPGVRILEIQGDNGQLPLDPDENTVGSVIKRYLKHLGRQDVGVEIRLTKKMPLKSGLGSSAASSVVGVFALNKLLGTPMKTKELLPFVMEGERLACGTAHADNVAPCLLGGFVLVRSYDPLDVIQLPVPEDLYAAIIHPRIDVQTKDARDILRKQIYLKDAVVQWGNIAGLVAGIIQSDYDLIGRSMQDVLIEPTRSILIPGFSRVKAAALEAGALGSGISGSGPSVFALCKGKPTAEAAIKAMEDVFIQMDIACDTYVSAVNETGPKVLG